MVLGKNQIIDVEVHSLSNDGNGVASFEGKTIFVSNAAPGDKLKVKILKDQKSYAFARIEEILVPSKNRITPPCPIAGQCGGCDFQHIDYNTELTAKQGFVKDALRRIGQIDAEPLPIIASTLEFRYRNKVQYPVNSTDGNLKYGFFAKRSHRVIPCEDCLLQPKILNDIASFVVTYLGKHGIIAYDESTNKGLLRHIYLRYSFESNTVMLCLVCTKTKLKGAAAFIDTVTAKFSELETIVLNINAERTNVICGEKNIVLYGTGVLKDKLYGVPLILSPHSFCQINKYSAEKLLYTIDTFALPSKNDTLLDLYCGAGVIGLSMAKKCKKLIGVEIVPDAIIAAQKSAEKMGLQNTEFICSDAGQAAKQLALNNIKPSIITIDPPRKGCDENTISAVLSMCPQKIVMVSCNPATLARDLAKLVQGGYILEKVQPVDLFPKTHHVETVVLMSKISE